MFTLLNPLLYFQQILEKTEPEFLQFKNERQTWLRPVKLQQLLDTKSQHSDSKLIVGNTEVGVEMKFKGMRYPVIISCSQVPELNELHLDDEGVSIGASVTLSRIETFLKQSMEKIPEYKCKTFAAIVEMLHWFAGNQIRNVAGIGGNVVTGSPISDLNPILMAAKSTLTFAATDGTFRSIPMDEHFYTGYRKNAMLPNEVLLSIHVPFTRQTEYFKAYKQAHRRDDDIAIANAAFRVNIESGVVKDCSMAIGGMAPTTKLAVKTVNFMVKRSWNQFLLEEVSSLLADEMSLPPDAPGGMVEYRQSLVLSFFFKFYLDVSQQIVEFDNGCSIPVSATSATAPFNRPESKSTHIFQEVSDEQSLGDIVGRPIVHSSAYKQATGEAVYVDDMVPLENELYIAFIYSTKAHAEIKSVDPSKALSVEGVHTYVDHRDVPGNNDIGSAAMIDEELFATKLVRCVGQVIGGIVADNQDIAQRAAKLVKIEYEEFEPIVTIEDAIAKSSFLSTPQCIENGNIKEGFRNSDNVIEGEMRVGEQEHFYLETNACRAIPVEDGGMEILSSTQNPSLAQSLVARVLGLQKHRVTCRVKRLGGGFGGKETRSDVFSSAIAVAANKVKRPVRCMLDRDEDMSTTGTRHAFLGRYKVGFTNDGKVQALEIDMYSNCGYSMDLSFSIMERALFHMDNAYKISNIKGTGYLCKTNIPSNTAFRGFGGPQGMMIVENWIGDVAIACGISQKMVREINMYKEGDLTHFNQKLVDFNLKRCWDECLKSSEYDKRRIEVEKFNKANRWKKRGICAVPTKFGIAFTALFMNQAGALVLVYTDGSVLLTHGGVEMGQGLHTKMIQVASQTLGISSEKIYINETSTNTVPNTSPSAASASSDLYGMAIKNACEKILERIKTYAIAKPNASWEDWVKAAYFDRVSLSATGFYKTPGIGYNWDTNSGSPFNYFTFGVAVSEVEVDCLTGDHVVLRTDIVMDVGDSINPAIDIGQIEGGFIQGYGLFTLEEHRWSPSGQLLTKGPGFYKIPGFTDIPVEFNVSLLSGVPNKRAVCSSKAIGEPPLFLASSVFYAIKDAILSARHDAGTEGIFRLDSPATAERIRMACADQFTAKFPSAVPGTFRPFFVRS
ncbi:xanthine dehydrogenase/oxidase-like [Anneissia japonica]|uniref:xanthine dehydrogenase/oxidase-like n=1 Tax=Anneissia japonica TaxID=1529436 RepID=UPI001425753A|nr:xanthine dehydrogenase/oxidase-like [Anneissia japonica]